MLATPFGTAQGSASEPDVLIEGSGRHDSHAEALELVPEDRLGADEIKAFISFFELLAFWEEGA